MNEPRTNGPERGLVVREEFAASQASKGAETAMAAVQARERAAIEAMYVMAERHPRAWDTVRVNVLAHCRRPRFAEVAMYRKPVGKKQINGEWRDQYVEGLSARFAEAASQEAGNIAKGSLVVYEDDLIRIVRAFVTDVQRNVTLAAELTIAKAVERKGKRKGADWLPPEGREVISSRLNSYGEPVFLVRATDDEVKNKQNSEISKAQRNFVLQLLPPDIKDEAQELIRATLADPQASDPSAAKKRIVDSFAEIGVMPQDLVTYLGGQLDTLVPAQLQDLRGLYSAIRDGDTTFQEALRLRYDTPAEGEEESRPAHDARLQRQMRDQEEVAQARIAEVKRRSSAAPGADPPADERHSSPLAATAAQSAADPTEEQMREWERMDQIERERDKEPGPRTGKKRGGF